MKVCAVPLLRLFLLFLFGLMVGSSAAQQTPPNRSDSTLSRIRIMALPEEARLWLDGNWFDREEMQNLQVLPGWHRMRVVSEGRMPGEAGFWVEQGTVVDVDVQEHTARGALLRSALFPGSGQRAAGAKAKGNILMAVTVTTTALALYSHLEYFQKRSDYDGGRSRYRQATDIAEVERLRAETVTLFDDADQAHSQRVLVSAAALAFYGYNLLDAFLFHSRTYKLTPSVRSGELSVRPLFEVKGGGVGLGLAFGF